MKKIVVILLVVIVLGGGSYFLWSQFRSSSQNNSSVPSISPTPNPAATIVPTVAGQTVVVLTEKGFEPASLTIKAGQTVVWLNKSGAAATVNSDNHPLHLLYSPLNLGKFEDGEKLQLTFEKPGKYGYHDHFHASKRGVIIVE
jgi:plastocyanin